MLDEFKHANGKPGASYSATSLLLLATTLGIMGCVEGETVYSTEPSPVDLDQDGFKDDIDCDDTDDLVNPDAAEDPDGDGDGDDIDNDCDGYIDENTDDGDDDFDGYTEREGDCDDDNVVVYPDRSDGCDGIDNDCDSYIDEDAVDDYEENDSKGSAVQLGDITCQAVSVYLNMLPSGNSSDKDFFIVEVEDLGDDAPPGCTFGVTATLGGIPSGEAVTLRIYDSAQDSAIQTASAVGSANNDSVVAQWDGSEGSGLFYIEVASNTASDYCEDSMRLTIQGMSPPTFSDSE